MCIHALGWEEFQVEPQSSATASTISELELSEQALLRVKENQSKMNSEYF